MLSSVTAACDFLKDSTDVVVLRGLTSLKGGEVISADSY